MSLDANFDKNTFLNTTCRCCSRFFSENVKFYNIFEEKFKNSFIDDDSVDIFRSESLYEPSQEILDIFEEFDIWKLNVSFFLNASTFYKSLNALHLIGQTL